MINKKTILLIVMVLATSVSVIGCSTIGMVNNTQIVKSDSNESQNNSKRDTYNPMLMLVNDKYYLNKDFVPVNLEVVNISFSGAASKEEKQMEYEASKAMEKLVQGALEDGIYLYGVSGYRSFELQQHIYDVNVSNNGQEYTNSYIAIPGRSEHQTGLSMDIGDASGNLIEKEEQVGWINNNSYKYGYIVRYPKGKESITGYNYEPWHIRYVGVEVASEIYNKNITFEEYCGY
ncbi:MAG: M15 family metallopeptidase [Clostridium sp.]